MSDDLNVPWLRAGVGKSPADGGCVMQVIDWVSRNEWTDDPPCVHPVLRKLAVAANDSLDDDGRQRLLDLVPRLMGTESDDKRLAVGLAVFCAERVLPIFEARYPEDMRPRAAIEVARSWLQTGYVSVRDSARAARAARAARKYSGDVEGAYAYSAYLTAVAVSYFDQADYDAASAASASYATRAADAENYDLLLAVLGEYDRLTGRKNLDPIDLSPAAKAMAGVA